MPALVWCRRRWRTASDDYTFSSLLYFSAFAACGVMGLAAVTTSDRSSADSSGSGDAPFNYLRRCPGASYTLGACFLGLCIVSIVAAVLFLVTAAVSMRGAIFEVSKRRLVPALLWVDSAAVLALFVLTCICSKYALHDGERHRCGSMSGRIIVGTLVLDFLMCFLYILSFVIVFDPSGRKTFDNPEEYAHTWWKRCSLLCCYRCRENRDDDAFMDVATVFSQAFRAYDVVPSDVAAGMLLLHGYQYHSRAANRNRVRFGPPLDGSDAEEIVSAQAAPAVRLTEEERELVRELQRYSRFYMAAYGYLLFEYQHCCTGFPRLCLFDPCMCCRHHAGRHYDAGCYWDVTALLKATAIPEEDLLYTSWSNHVCRPVHYVCYDRSSDAVVIAIRGTMSFIDVATDFAATPEVVQLDGAPVSAPGEKGYDPDDYYIHGGMLASARYVRRCLEYNGLLDMITTGRFRDKKVVVLGHSLGGGVALVLSVLLHSEEPRLRGRMRCLAYAPPGGTLSEAVVEYAAGFTVGCFRGLDMIPRLALHTFDAFREALFDVAAASPVPKSMVFLRASCTKGMSRPLHPSAGDAAAEPSEESARYREALREGHCVPAEQPKKLYPCKRLIHIRKAVKRRARPCATAGCCGCFDCGIEEIYYPCVEGPEQLQMLVAAPTMFTDHLPDRLFDTMKDVVEQMDRMELERFYQDGPLEERSMSGAPLHYVPPRSRTTPTSGTSQSTPTTTALTTTDSLAASMPLQQGQSMRGATSENEPVHSYGSIV